MPAQHVLSRTCEPPCHRQTAQRPAALVRVGDQETRWLVIGVDSHPLRGESLGPQTLVYNTEYYDMRSKNERLRYGHVSVPGPVGAVACDWASGGDAADELCAKSKSSPLPLTAPPAACSDHSNRDKNNLLVVLSDDNEDTYIRPRHRPVRENRLGWRRDMSLAAVCDLVV
ncbi:hypothetical protein BCR34DRAFT_593697 [Clohesyomyces aquaticus]|uniref:Uncharacterized protein n=1 Tax=Clohesyomyces aquaticus TaxID=1231657 RepID=A0A1Y1YG26_9PLEO|nr:hypothetical protein BCR34DRAFT_593697 [Clohesyomyces aquaticus]